MFYIERQSIGKAAGARDYKSTTASKHPPEIIWSK